MQAHEGASMLKRRTSPKAMRFLVMPSNSIWIETIPFVLRYDQVSALLIDAKYRLVLKGKKKTGRILQYGNG